MLHDEREKEIILEELVGLVTTDFKDYEQVVNVIGLKKLCKTTFSEYIFVNEFIQGYKSLHSLACLAVTQKFL